MTRFIFPVLDVSEQASVTKTSISPPAIIVQDVFAECMLPDANSIMRKIDI
jgi:hypothetical protein